MCTISACILQILGSLLKLGHGEVDLNTYVCVWEGLLMMNVPIGNCMVGVILLGPIRGHPFMMSTKKSRF